MACLWRNDKTGEWYFRIWQNGVSSTRVLNDQGLDRIKRKRLNVGDRVPQSILQRMHFYTEARPLQITATTTDIAVKSQTMVPNPGIQSDPKLITSGVCEANHLDLSLSDSGAVMAEVTQESKGKRRRRNSRLKGNALLLSMLRFRMLLGAVLVRG